MEKVRNAPALELDDIARLWDDTLDTSAAMKEMEDTISNFVASGYSIYRAYHVIEDTKSTLSKKIKNARAEIKDA
ncbi:MAG: hypothetical protein J6T10_02355 [Methanobrevibacter sp.]|nr:hypothetical protein [Methanobrevibacter sp.]